MGSVQEIATLIREQITPTYPALRVEIEGDLVLVKGLLPIVNDGNELDRFDVTIVIPAVYPRFPPKVWEVGGRIPRSEDRHCGKDGAACLMVEEEYWFNGWDRKSFLDFLDGPVRSHFIYQLTVEEKMDWPHGQRPHGNLGIAEFYRERFGIGDESVILRCLELSRFHILKGHNLCPCGSGKRIRSCHTEWRSMIKSIKGTLPAEQVEKTIGHLRRHQPVPSK